MATTPVTNTGTSNTASAGSSDTSTARRALDTNYQDFLKLLTTQLQNQDPTAPADTNQLTQQIATLSQVEQQININSSLKQLISLYGDSQTSAAVSYIGKQVEAEGDKGVLMNKEAAFVYDLPDAASSVTLTIKNAAGQTVYTGAGTTLAGRNQVVWNGVNGTTGADSPNGVYTMVVTAKDSAGKDMADIKTFTTGIVRSVDTVDGISTLALGSDVSIALDKVTSVRTPGT